MSGFAYSVAIRLSVANLASQGVKLLAKDLLAAHGAATKLQDKLSALKMIAAGYGMEKTGQGIVHFLGKAIDASKDYTHQLSLMNAAGFTQKELAESTAAAWKTSSLVITSTAADNLTAIRELRSAFGKGEGMQHAYAVLPQVQRVSGILESLTGRKQEHVGFDMVKAIEMGTKGALTVDSMMRQSEMMSRALVQMGGTLSVQDFHQTIKQTRALAPYLSDDFKYNYMPTLMQEMKTGVSGGAGSAGTALASLGQVIVGQMIPKALITNWEMVGLLSRDKVVKDPHNRTTDKMLPGAVAGAKMFAENPYLWAQQYLKPAVEKGMKLNPALDQYGSILSLTHNRVAAFAMQTLINKGAQFERDKKLITEGPTSYSSYQRLLKSDPEMAEKAMHNQWQNLLAIIGYQILPKMIPFMIKFANGLNAISTWMEAHPIASSSLVIGLGALGVGLDITGKAMMTIGMLKLFGMAKTLTGIATAVEGLGAAASVAEGAEGVGGIAGLAAALGTGSPLVIALGVAALAIGGLVVAAKLLSGPDVKHNDGKDVGISEAGAGRGSRRIVGLHWVQDRYGRAGTFGHYEGVGSGAKNGTKGPNGETISNDYSFVPPPKKVAFNVINTFDKNGIATMITDHQNRAASRRNSGTSTFDGSRSMQSVAFG